MEGQVQEFESKENRAHKRQLTQAQVEIRRQKEILLLSRARVEKQLQSIQDARYREQLSRALADLDAQLSKLNETE